MKNLKLKAFLVAAIATMGSLNAAALTNPNSAPASTKSGNGLWAVNNDLSNIKADKNNIAVLKEKLKNDCQAGNKSSVILRDQNELKKAKADLNRNENYLMADRKESIKDHELLVSKWRETVRDDKSRLSLSKHLMRQDIAKQDAGGIKTDATLITENQQALKNDQLKLDNEQKALDADVAYINKGIREVNGSLFAMFNKNTQTESSYAIK